MRKAGIVGGIGPASTLDYYSGIISGVKALSKSEEYPKLIIDSVDMTEMIGYVASGDRLKLTDLLAASVGNLAAAGAAFAAIASNTPHIVFNEVSRRTTLPLISIVEETCRAAVCAGLRRVAVLGTLFTMRSGLYTEAFRKCGIKAVVPDSKIQEQVYALIYPNLENGIVVKEDKARLIDIAGDLIRATDAEALVLGCTELPLAIKPGDLDTPLLDTMQIHIEAIVREVLS